MDTIYKLTRASRHSCPAKNYFVYAAEDPAASPSAVGRKAATNIHGVASMRQIRPRKSRPRAVIGWGGATVAPGPRRYPQPVALLPCINTARAGGELTHPPTHQQSTVHSQQYRLELAELLQCELASYSPNVIHGSPAPPFHALRPQEGNYCTPFMMVNSVSKEAMHIRSCCRL
jgi:hypothetical protein